jgi:hypothetical protein
LCWPCGAMKVIDEAAVDRLDNNGCKVRTSSRVDIRPWPWEDAKSSRNADCCTDCTISLWRVVRLCIRSDPIPKRTASPRSLHDGSWIWGTWASTIRIRFGIVRIQTTAHVPVDAIDIELFFSNRFSPTKMLQDKGDTMEWFDTSLTRNKLSFITW